MTKLFAFYLGGKAKNARIEVHDVVFSVGNTIEDCYDDVKQKWFGITTNLHIDAYMEVSYADGYEIKIVKPTDHIHTIPKNLYFINLGGSKPDEFFEYHKSGFVVAGSQMGAMSRAKSKFCVDFEDKHVDNALDIDNCLNVNDEINGYKIFLTPIDQLSYEQPKIVTCFLAVK
jgi:hypothetical protein